MGSWFFLLLLSALWWMRLRLVQASWWEVLIVGKTGPCCSGQGCALNPIICWWVGLHSLLNSLAWGYPALESKSPACMLSCFTYVWLFATPWTVARQAPLSMGFSRKENWNGLPYPPPGDLPNPGIEPRSPTLQADSLPAQPPGKPFVFWFISTKLSRRLTKPSAGLVLDSIML